MHRRNARHSAGLMRHRRATPGSRTCQAAYHIHRARQHEFARGSEPTSANPPRPRPRPQGTTQALPTPMRPLRVGRRCLRRHHCGIESRAARDRGMATGKANRAADRAGLRRSRRSAESPCVTASVASFRCRHYARDPRIVERPGSSARDESLWGRGHCGSGACGGGQSPGSSFSRRGYSSRLCGRCSIMAR
jgi:hypothetical protein